MTKIHICIICTGFLAEMHNNGNKYFNIKQLEVKYCHLYLSYGLEHLFYRIVPLSLRMGVKLLWDDEIPKQLQCKWQSWVESLISLDSINFDRCVIPKEYVGGVSELIIFSDASRLAYGAMAYIRTINKTRKIHVSLLMSKTRLLPLKGMTIPRAELCAALIGCRLECMIREQLDIDLIPTTFFTDSEIVLSYIKNEDKCFKTFEANRVAEIRDSSDPDQWFHIEGTKNPADILSRGCNGNDIPAEWFYGPSFLHDFKCNWPKSGDMPDLVNNSEVIMPKSCTNASSQKDMHPLDKLTAITAVFIMQRKLWRGYYA